MLKSLGLTILSLLPLSVCASDFDDVLNTIVGNSIAMKYGDADRQASISEMKADNTLEAPEVSYENLWGAKGIGDKRNFSVSQSFDWPGIYMARREAIKKSETAMQFLRESELLDVRMEVRLLLIDIIYAKQRLQSTKEICDGMAELSATFKKAMEEGNETRLDYNKAVIERITSERELKAIEGEYAVLVSSLKALNGGADVNALIERLGDDYPMVDLSTLRPDAEKLRLNDPSQAAAAASLEAQKSLVKVENRSLMPGFTLGYIHEWEMGDNFNGFSVSMTLPFLTGKKKVTAAKQRVKAMEIEKEMSLIKLLGELDGEYENACALQSLIKEYDGVVHDNSNIALLKKALDGGQINFLTYMQEVNYFLAAHRDYHETLYRYNVSLARLQRYN